MPADLSNIIIQNHPLSNLVAAELHRRYKELEMAKIIPTIGRKVHFYPPRTPTGAATGLWNVISQEQPLDATVVYVHNDTTINVMVIDHRGNMRFQDFVQLVNEGEPKPANQYPYCQWMPYQTAVARGETPAVLHAKPKAE